MKEQGQISRQGQRRIFWRLLTVVLFTQLCANVTILEYFGGNLSLGIESFRQVVEKNHHAGQSSRPALTKAPSDKSQFPDNDDSDIPFDGDDFFCFSSHSFIGVADLTASFTPVIPQQYTAVFFHRQDHTDRHQPPFYHPPRIA